MNRFEQRGKVVLITGATSGIGEACAIAFARQGARLALLGRNGTRLSKVVQSAAEISKGEGGSAEGFELDLRQTDQIPATVDEIKRKIGPVDVLLNNAAYAVAGLIEDCPVDQYKRNFEVNFFAVLSLIQAVLPGMKVKRAGQIINVSSGVGKRALPGFSSYCATKFALNGLTESLRLEVKPHGIDVLLISPGRVSSDFHNRIEFYGRWRMRLPPMQMRSPDQIAELILDASRKRMREATVWGPGLAGYHLNYWSPRLVDFLLAKKYPTG